MSMTEITVRAYWQASRSLTARQSPADRAALTDMLAHIAVYARGRVAAAAARRLQLERSPILDDGFGGNVA